MFRSVVGLQYASQILTKETVIDPEMLADLGQTELAVVDWLILKESRVAGAQPLTHTQACVLCCTSDLQY